MFQTNYVGGQPQFPVADTILTNISISGAQQERRRLRRQVRLRHLGQRTPRTRPGPGPGAATFNNLTLTNNAVDIRNTAGTFTITRN